MADSHQWLQLCVLPVCMRAAQSLTSRVSHLDQCDQEAYWCGCSLNDSEYLISKCEFSGSEDLRAWEAVNPRFLHELSLAWPCSALIRTVQWPVWEYCSKAVLCRGTKQSCSAVLVVSVAWMRHLRTGRQWKFFYLLSSIFFFLSLEWSGYSLSREHL